MKPDNSKSERKKPRQPREHERRGGTDRVMTASIDSFPASDPPGWIEITAHPSEETLARDARGKRPGDKSEGSGKT